MENRPRKPSRRTFVKRSSVAAAGIALGLQHGDRLARGAARGANERIRVGFIGVGNRGTQLLQGFLKQDDVEVAALCDIYEPYLNRDFSKVDARLRETLGGRVPKMTETTPEISPPF